MKLRASILLFTLIGSLLAIAMIYSTTQSIILSAFQRLEEREARTNALRVVGLLDEEQAQLVNDCAEWAGWDATSRCMHGDQREFERRGLIAPSFSHLGIDNLILLDIDGDVVLSRGFDLQAGLFIPSSQDLIAFVQTPEFLIQAASGVSGVLMLPRQAVLLAACPIVPALEEAPSRGLLIITHPLDDERAAKMSRIVQLPLSLDRYDALQPVVDLEILRTDPQHIMVSLDNHQRLTSRVLETDIVGQPALVWSIPLNREIYQQGHQAIHRMAAIVTLIIIGFGAMLLWLIHHKVIRPLGRLSSELGAVGANGDLSGRVTASGQDEFSALARKANQTLERLEQSHKALQTSEQLWRGLVETIPDLIFRVSVRVMGSFHGSDEPDELLTEASIDTVSRLPWMDETDPVGIISAVLRALPSDHPDEWPPVITFDHKVSGQRHTYEARLAAMDNGQVLGMIRNVTADQRNREALNRAMDELETRVAARTRELQATNDQLRQEIADRQRAEADKERIQAQLLQSQKLEAIGLLAGGVAHDFNNLLTTIQGYNEMALIDIPADSPVHADLEQVAEACTRAAGLTRQLLLFSRRQPMTVAPIELNAIIEGLVKMLRRLIGEDIAIDVQLDPELWPVEADAGRIEQIITNLVVNARDAMPDGGTLTIRSENASSGLPSDMPVPDTGQAVCVAISDTGIGMDDYVQEHCFEPFFTTKEAGKGTGMGLSVVYGILQQHYGSATIESEIGRGTTIRCYLPAIPPSRLTDDVAARPKLTHAARGEHILLVEDDRGVRAFTTRILEASHYRVSAAGTPAEAHALFDDHSQNIDLLITDVVLPGGGGLQLLDEFLQRRPDLSVIVSSGYLDDRSQRDVLTARGLPYLAKPYTVNDLLEAVEAALGKSERDNKKEGA